MGLIFLIKILPVLLVMAMTIVYNTHTKRPRYYRNLHQEVIMKMDSALTEHYFPGDGVTEQIER